VKIIGVFIGVIIVLAWSVLGIAVDRFVNAAKGNNLNGANDCRDPAIPCQTITQAIEKADSGDIIKVNVGTYSKGKNNEQFPLRLTKKLWIVAMDPERTVIDAEGEPVAIEITGKEAHGSLIQGFTIKGSKEASIKIIKITDLPFSKEVHTVVKGNKIEKGKGTGPGILLSSSSSIRIEGNTIIGNKDDRRNNDGIRLEESSNNEILDNEISDNGKDGIFLVGSTGNTIAGNELKDNGLIGISIIPSQIGAVVSVISSNNTISRNTVTNSLIGILLGGPPPTPIEKDKASENNKLQRNTTNNNTLAGIRLLGNFKGITLTANIAKNNMRRAGIELSRGIFNDTVLSGNIADDNGKDEKGIPQTTTTNGIDFQPVGGVGNNLLSNEANGNTGSGIIFTGSTSTLSGNTANSNGKSGIELSGSNNTLSNNTANNNVEAAGIALTQGSENRLLNNTALSNGIGISLKSSKSNKLIENTVKNNRCNGIELEKSSQNEIRNNVVTLNVKDCPTSDKKLLGGGIALIGESSSNKISGNVIQENFNGISIRVVFDVIQGRNENVLACNNILRNEKNGIQLLSQVVGNAIQRNNIEGNQGFGVRNFMD